MRKMKYCIRYIAGDKVFFWENKGASSGWYAPPVTEQGKFEIEDATAIVARNIMTLKRITPDGSYEISIIPLED